MARHGRARRTAPEKDSRLGPRAVPRWTTVLAPVAAGTFSELDVSVSLRGLDPPEWYPIHITPNVARFEFEHGSGAQRYAYNGRSLEETRRTNRIVVGEHAGYKDMFVPVGDGDDLCGILCVGPFATSRPTSAEVRARWHALTLEHERLSDPSFSEYVAATLSTLTLDGPLLIAFERFMSCFALLLGRQGDPRAHAAEASQRRLKLQDARYCERMWDAVREMIDPRTPPTWAAHHHETLTYAGLHALPQHAVVGLLLGDADESDPLDGLLRRDAFQRACVGLARRFGNAVSGRIGSHGVALLIDATGRADGTRAKLVELAHKAGSAARRFGLTLHCGLDLPEAPAALSFRYESALHAAEKALSERRAIVFGEPRRGRSVRLVRAMRDQLAHGAGESPGMLSPRFDQYIESVLVHCGYRIEPVRAQLEIGVQKLVEPLLETGALDEKAFDDMCLALESNADDARTVSAVGGLYRRLVADIANVLSSPTRARQERGIEAGLLFIREHLCEPLSLTRVARASGFASGYFSKLFRREQKVAFERYVRQLRIKRAEQMLTDTTLSVERVRRLSGFQTRSLFFRAFRESSGMTPQGFRRRGSRQYDDRS